MERKSINFNFYFRFNYGKPYFNDYRNYEITKFKIYYELLDGSLLKINIYDSIGEKKYSSEHEKYYKKADSFILVYDINDKKTFESCNEFIDIIKKTYKRNVKVMLIGNKSDIKNKREVSEKQRIDFKLLHQCESFETSCVNNENITLAFETLIEITIKEIVSIDSNEYNNKIVLKKEKKEIKNNKCFH